MCIIVVKGALYTSDYFTDYGVQYGSSLQYNLNNSNIILNGNLAKNLYLFMLDKSNEKFKLWESQTHDDGDSESVNTGIIDISEGGIKIVKMS